MAESQAQSGQESAPQGQLVADSEARQVMPLSIESWSSFIETTINQYQATVDSLGSAAETNGICESSNLVNAVAKQGKEPARKSSSESPSAMRRYEDHLSVVGEPATETSSLTAGQLSMMHLSDKSNASALKEPKASVAASASVPGGKANRSFTASSKPRSANDGNFHTHVPSTTYLPPKAESFKSEINRPAGLKAETTAGKDNIDPLGHFKSLLFAGNTRWLVLKRWANDLTELEAFEFRLITNYCAGDLARFLKFIARTCEPGVRGEGHICHEARQILWREASVCLIGLPQCERAQNPSPAFDRAYATVAESVANDGSSKRRGEAEANAMAALFLVLLDVVMADRSVLFTVIPHWTHAQVDGLGSSCREFPNDPFRHLDYFVEQTLSQLPHMRCKHAPGIETLAKAAQKYLDSWKAASVDGPPPGQIYIPAQAEKQRLPWTPYSHDETIRLIGIALNILTDDALANLKEALQRGEPEDSKCAPELSAALHKEDNPSDREKIQNSMRLGFLGPLPQRIEGLVSGGGSTTEEQGAK